MRGYFQGKNDLRPYGTSLIIEQAVRVLVILAGTLLLARIDRWNDFRSCSDQYSGIFLWWVSSDYPYVYRRTKK